MSIGRSSHAQSGELGPHTTRLLIYGLVAIFLMVLDHRGHYLDRFHRWSREFTEPLLLVIDWPIDRVHRVSQWLGETQALISERDQLRRALVILEAQQLTVDAIADENQELKALLGLSESLSIDYISARVRAVDLNPFAHRVLIDRGRVDGLAPSWSVVDQYGLIGQLETVSATSARVILITDPDHALPVRIERTGTVTLAYGGGLDGRLSLSDLPLNVDLIPGDRLLTSGLGGVFPPGLPVAVVESVERPSGQNFALARAYPVSAPDRAQFVLVVVPEVGSESIEAETQKPSELEGLSNG